MSDIYNDHFGTAFGIYSITDSTPGHEGDIKGYGTHWHSYRDYGLHPRKKPVITTPTVRTVMIDIPGRDGLYDATEALTGDIHYANRKGTFEYVQTGGRSLWDGTYYKLKNELHGQRKDIIIDEEPDGYYTGRLFVEEPTYDDKKGVAYFTITADLEPWKKALTLIDQDWLWDPFSFENGVIQPKTGNTLIAEHGSASAIQWDIIGTRMPVVPHVYLENAEGDSFTPTINMTYTNINGVEKTVMLTLGDNVDNTPDFQIREGEHHVVKFEGVGQNGRGVVRMSYREGWL